MRIIAALDPGFGSGQHSAAVVIGFTEDGGIELLDSFSEVHDPWELGRAYAAMLHRWKPDVALCEQVGFQSYVIEAVRAAGGVEVRPCKPLRDKRQQRDRADHLLRSSGVDFFDAWPQDRTEDFLDATAMTIEAHSTPEPAIPHMIERERTD